MFRSWNKQLCYFSKQSACITKLNKNTTNKSVQRDVCLGRRLASATLPIQVLFEGWHRLMNNLCVGHYNWSEHSACSTCLDENAVGCSFLLLSKKVRKQSPLKNNVPLFLTFLIRAHWSDLRHFCRDWYCTHYACTMHGSIVNKQNLYR